MRGLKLVFTICGFLYHFVLISNQDSVIYTRDYTFKEGIYLSYDQFRNNEPIPVNKIVSKYDKLKHDFLSYIVSANSIHYFNSSGSEIKVSTDKIWGYNSNNSVYVRLNHSFSRVQIIGNICHFVGLFENYVDFPDPFATNRTMAGRVEYKQQQAIIDSKTGEIQFFNVSSMREILSRDPELLKEFDSLKKRKQRTSIFIYLQKYNQKHPLYFPKGE